MANTLQARNDNPFQQQAGYKNAGDTDAKNITCQSGGVHIRKLIMEAEQWALSLGYRELASDTSLDNIDSIVTHEAVGFKEVERTVNFLKTLKNNTSQ